MGAAGNFVPSCKEPHIGDEEIETLAGLIFFKTSMPKEGDQISFNEFDAEIQEMEASRIRKVKIHPKRENSSTTYSSPS